MSDDVISIKRSFTPADVDLWNDGVPNFRTVVVTRSRQVAIAALEKELSGLEDDGTPEAADTMIGALARLLDELLEPVEGKGKASTLIVKKWKADEATADEIMGLFQALIDRSRPT